eukprot:GILI01010214.1.p1 GENE.GILI01010214.1~~GILI01010214.1.p1  ORF type:complete len:397 (-),score=77.97 GILI01010214.1:34-1134(-)
MSQEAIGILPVSILATVQNFLSSKDRARFGLCSRASYLDYSIKRLSECKHRLVRSFIKRNKRQPPCISESGSKKFALKIPMSQIPSDFLMSKFTKADTVLTQHKQGNLESHKVSFKNTLSDSLTFFSSILPGNSADSDSSSASFSFLSSSSEFSPSHHDFSSKESLIARQKAILARVHKKAPTVDPLSSVRALLEKKGGVWVVILCHGGNFAGAVYDQGVCIAHKTDHRYVVRKQAGQRQVSCDKSYFPKSGGAHMRRYNETKHQEHIADVLEEWTEYLQQADLIFIHAPGINKSFFLGDHTPIRPTDPRIRSIPLTSAKPTFSEVQRVFDELFSAELWLSVEDAFAGDYERRRMEKNARKSAKAQ